MSAAFSATFSARRASTSSSSSAFSWCMTPAGNFSIALAVWARTNGLLSGTALSTMVGRNARLFVTVVDCQALIEAAPILVGPYSVMMHPTHNDARANTYGSGKLSNFLKRTKTAEAFGHSRLDQIIGSKAIGFGLQYRSAVAVLILNEKFVVRMM